MYNAFSCPMTKIPSVVSVTMVIRAVHCGTASDNTERFNMNY